MFKQFEKISESAAQAHIEYVKAANELSSQGTKGLMYLNGVATITVMTFLGHHEIDNFVAYLYFSLSILFFAFGSMMGVITYFQMYASQLSVSRLYEIVHTNFQSFANLPPRESLTTEYLKSEASNLHKTLQEKLSVELDENKTERNTLKIRLRICQFSTLFCFVFGLGSALGGIAYPSIKYYSFIALLIPTFILLIIFTLFGFLGRKRSSN